VSKVTALQDRKPAEASESKIVGERKERLIIGITGASGVVLGIKALELLRQIEAIETHLVISPAAEVTIAKETDWKISDVLALADVTRILVRQLPLVHFLLLG
jgi:hypothetical protein